MTTTPGQPQRVHRPSGPRSGSTATLPAVATLLRSPVRRAVVDELAALDPAEREIGLTAVELGRRLKLHSTTIRFHVDQLVEAGVLDAYFARSGGVGRPSKCYLLREVPLGDSASASADQAPFAMLAGVLASALSTDEVGALTPEEAGIRWVRRRAEQSPPPPEATAEGKLDQVVELLSAWGYSPEAELGEDGGVDVTLRQCPFLELAHAHPDVVCGMHRGLLRGALAAVGENDTRVSLQPFVGPDTCRARIYLTQGQAPAARPVHPGCGDHASPDPQDGP